MTRFLSSMRFLCVTPSGRRTTGTARCSVMSASVTGMASSRGRNIEWQGDDFAAYEQHLGQIKDQMLEDVYDDLNDIGQDAKSNIRHMIQMSGTATRPDGRVETGAMLEAVDYVVTRMGDEIEL